jgi:hypothetical protein
MPAIDTRFFWERDFSMDEGFCFERGQPANRGLDIHVLETIDPPLIRSTFSSACARWVLLDFL